MSEVDEALLREAEKELENQSTNGAVKDVIRRLADSLRVCEEEKGKLEGKWEKAGDRCPQCGTGQQPRIEKAEQEVERLTRELEEVNESRRHYESEATAQLLDASLALAQEQQRVQELREAVDRQAEDEGLWFEARTAPEAYLQQELRELQALIEAQLPNPSADEEQT